MDVQEQIDYQLKVLNESKDYVSDDNITFLFSGALMALDDFCNVKTLSVAASSEIYQTLIQHMQQKMTVFLAIKNLTEEQKFHIYDAKMN